MTNGSWAGRDLAISHHVGHVEQKHGQKSAKDGKYGKCEAIESRKGRRFTVLVAVGHSEVQVNGRRCSAPKFALLCYPMGLRFELSVPLQTSNRHGAAADLLRDDLRRRSNQESKNCYKLSPWDEASSKRRFDDLENRPHHFTQRSV